MSLNSVDKEETKQEIKETVQENQLQTDEIKQNPVILSIDPAFVKMGMCIMEIDTKKILESFQIAIKPDKKMTQTQMDGYLSKNIQKIIDQLFQKYKVEYVVIELQLGQFSANRIQLALVHALPYNVKYTIQHSKLKLKHPDINNIIPDNLESKKYNQNKHQGRQLAQKLYPELTDLSFDEYDSILHAVYALNNIKKIEWIKKDDLN